MEGNILSILLLFNPRMMRLFMKMSNGKIKINKPQVTMCSEYILCAVCFLGGKMFKINILDTGILYILFSVHSGVAD